MPCRYYEPGELDKITLKQLRAELDLATRVLCYMLTKWERAGEPFPIDTTARDWWARHKEMDRNRIANEERKAAVGIKEKK